MERGDGSRGEEGRGEGMGRGEGREGRGVREGEEVLGEE